MRPMTRLLLLTLAVMMTPLAAAAQTEEEEPPPTPVQSLEVTTPYPGVVVEPGDQVGFDLSVRAPQATDVALSVEGVPEGWTAAFRGEGFEIDAVTAGPGLATTASFDITVPIDAAEDTYDLTVTAQGGGDTVTVPLSIRVSTQAGGEVTMTPDFPGLRGPAGETFTFNVELRNDTPGDVQFELAASGPAGWQVTAQPAGEAQASTISVASAASEQISVEVQAPASVDAGQYPVTVQATSPGTTVESELIVEVVGSFSLALNTVDERLNAEVTVGAASQIQLLVTNTGTASLQGVTLSATPPSDWDVTLDPEVVADIPPGETQAVTASVMPSGEAVAGDYLVNFSATHDEASADIEVRTSVNPSPLWGFVGIALIALTLAGLAWVFRRFGRR